MTLEISIADMRFHATHGVFPQENAVGNEFRVSVSVRIPWQPTEDDVLENTVSYADIHDLVVGVLERETKLIETLATRIVKGLLAKWPFIQSGKVTVVKPHPPIPRCQGHASVSLEF